MIARAAVLAEARKYAKDETKDGVRWRHMGRTEHGLDCVGLLVVVCAALGISGYDLKTYPREPKSSEFMDHFIRGGGTRIPINAALPADLMLFREDRYPCHVAILSERDGLPTIIHAHATRKMVIEEVLIPEWMAKRVAAIRLPGVG